MDKLQAMSVFVQIADSGSLTAAAGELGRSLPSVVRMLASLEADLQVRLFNRSTRRIALTEEGRVYLQRCRRILADVQETEALLTDNQPEPAGRITLTAPVRFGELYVAPAVTRLLARYPRLRVNLLLLDRVVNMLEEGIDLAVRIAPLADSTLIAKPVARIRQVVCASPELLANTGIPGHPDVLSNQPCVCFTGISDGTQWHFSEDERDFSVRVEGRLHCNQIGALVDACVSGAGFGYFYSYQVMPFIRQGRLRVVLEDYELPALPLSLVYPHREFMPSRVRRVRDWLAEELCAALGDTAPADSAPP